MPFSVSPYQPLGCFEDTASRAIGSIEGKDEVKHILDGNFLIRKNAIFKCYEAAKYLGFKVFALDADGRCSTSSDAENRYNMYGTGHRCKGQGKGGHQAINVYKITSSASGNYCQKGIWNASPHVIHNI